MLPARRAAGRDRRQCDGGQISAAFFPALFGPNADERLDEDAVRDAFDELARETDRTAEDVADGFIRIAVENMANAIKRISVAKGYDTRRYTLNCFGGAGGQHACLVADALGMTTIFIHPFASVLSAYGMKLAALRAVRQAAVNAALNENTLTHMRETAAALGAEAVADIAAQGGTAGAPKTLVHVRYAGSDTSLAVPLGDLRAMQTRFSELHAQLSALALKARN